MKKFLKLCLPLLALAGVAIIASPFIVSCSDTKDIKQKSFIELANNNRHKDISVSNFNPFVNPFTKVFINNLSNGRGNIIQGIKYETPLLINKEDTNNIVYINTSLLTPNLQDVVVAKNDEYNIIQRWVIGSMITNFTYVDVTYNFYISYLYRNNDMNNNYTDCHAYKLFYEVV